MSLKSPGKLQLLKTLRKLEKNPKTKEKLFGDIGIIGVGGTLGVAAAGSVAAVTGATSVWGLTTAASWLGVTVVSATPVGWIAGGAVTGAAAVYGISRLISGGAYNEGKLNELKKQLEERVKGIETKERASKISESDLNKFHLFLKKPLEDNLIKPDKAHKLMAGVEEGKIKLSVAYQLVENILASVKTK